MKPRLSILAIALAGLTISCTANDSAKNPAKKNAKPANVSLVGTWSHNDGTDIDYYQFNADGTGFEWDVEKNAPKNFQPRKKPFKYQIKGNRIIFTENDGDIDNEGLHIKSNDHIKIDHDSYHRVK